MTRKIVKITIIKYDTQIVVHSFKYTILVCYNMKNILKIVVDIGEIKTVYTTFCSLLMVKFFAATSYFYLMYVTCNSIIVLFNRSFFQFICLSTQNYNFIC